MAYPPGRGPQVQQLRVRGARPGLEGAERLDQSSRRKLRDNMRATRHARGRDGGLPKISLSGVTVSQAAGPVEMIIGRDNPEWMPVPVQEEPHERFTLMWTSLSPRYILRDNEGVDWRL